MFTLKYYGWRMPAALLTAVFLLTIVTWASGTALGQGFGVVPGIGPTAPSLTPYNPPAYRPPTSNPPVYRPYSPPITTYRSPSDYRSQRTNSSPSTNRTSNSYRSPSISTGRTVGVVQGTGLSLRARRRLRFAGR
jgi:hypothetical protein